jgi:hypothetical protein
MSKDKLKKELSKSFESQPRPTVLNESVLSQEESSAKKCENATLDTHDKISVE